MSSGRLFQSLGPAEANDRSPTVTRRDGRTSSWLEVDDRSRGRVETACLYVLQLSVDCHSSILIFVINAIHQECPGNEFVVCCFREKAGVSYKRQFGCER